MNKRSFSREFAILVSCLGLLVLILLTLMPRPALPAAALGGAPLPPPPALDSEAYFVRVAGEASPLMARRSWKRMAPASLTKIMTALVARERLAPDARVVFSPEAKAVEERRSDAAAGEIFLRDDAVRMALMESANDAGLALAEAVGAKSGKAGFGERVALFVRLMNDRAQALAMRDTHFENPVGLDAPGHLMSAEDLARLADEAFVRDPGLFAITREINAVVFSWGGKKHTILNTDELLKEFPAIAGGKTGFTDNAKGTLLLLYPVTAKEGISAAPLAPRQKIAIIVILKSADRFADGRKIINWLEENF